MKILGIETSCDETAVAIARFEDDRIEIDSSLISSQIDIHRQYGGVVPEVAAREHMKTLIPMLENAMSSVLGWSSDGRPDIDYIAITTGPGLITSLLAGTETARSLSFAWGIPLIPVNHIIGHIAASLIGRNLSSIDFPAVVLTVSGGHTILALMKDFSSVEILGETRDDAAGEAFDKAAKMLGIGYPGGPAISRLAKSSVGKVAMLPRPMIDSPDFDFSFSGLKTALLYELKKDASWESKIPDYCREYEQAIVDVLVSKTIKAATKNNARTVILSGGVASNERLRVDLTGTMGRKLPDTALILTDKAYTTDNAAMIAAAGCLLAGTKTPASWRELKANSNESLGLR